MQAVLVFATSLRALNMCGRIICMQQPVKVMMSHRTQLQQGLGDHGRLLALGCYDWRLQSLHSLVAGMALQRRSYMSLPTVMFAIVELCLKGSVNA